MAVLVGERSVGPGYESGLNLLPLPVSQGLGLAEVFFADRHPSAFAAVIAAVGDQIFIGLGAILQQAVFNHFAETVVTLFALMLFFPRPHRLYLLFAVGYQIFNLFPATTQVLFLPRKPVEIDRQGLPAKPSGQAPGQ
jgi:hypothetical protein